MTTDELLTILEIQNLPFEYYNLRNRKETFFCFPAKSFRKCEMVYDEEKNCLEYTDNKRFIRTYYNFAENNDDILELLKELFFQLEFLITDKEVAE